ncbi:MAG TPA: STAS domain-containing protein [Steroidobacteraceae bacterium]|nr:STAS domain-containing protein [Steroidobacteraceae bacterium]
MKRARKTTRRPAKARVRSPDTQPVTAVDAPLIDAASPAQAPRSAPAGLKLEASCTLRDSMDMQFQLLAVDFGDADVLVDGSAVERIDTAGLQMLLAFTKYHAARGKPVRWTAASPELLRSSQVLGLDGMLGLAPSTGRSSTSGG